MIQRIQSLYLLASIGVCFILFFLPLGYIHLDEKIRFDVTGFFHHKSGEMYEFNYLLSALLMLNMVLQLVSIFLFKKRKVQALLGQISMVLLLLFAVITLLYQDLFAVVVEENVVEEIIRYNWNITMIGIAWILTYLAVRAIKKDEALIRSTERMR